MIPQGLGHPLKDLFGVLFAVSAVMTVYFAIDARKLESKLTAHKEQQEAYARVVMSGLLGFCCFVLWVAPWLAQKLTGFHLQ